jgi:hypothetical protein
MFKHFSSYRRGESLLEAIIAIGVLITTLTYSATVFTSALQTLSFSRERAVAMFLSQEAVEGVQNIVGSNMVRLSGDKDACWNTGWTKPTTLFLPVADPSGCTLTRAIGMPNESSVKQYFSLVFDSAEDIVPGAFRLDLQGKPFSLRTAGCIDDVESPCLSDGTTAKAYALELVDIGSVQAYRHTAPDSFDNVRFFRGVSVQYPSSPDIMEVVSTVRWVERGKLQEINRTFVITKDHVF